MMGLFDDAPALDENRCCLCSKKRLTVRVRIEGQTYPFCFSHEHRGRFLERGKKHGWPALRIVGKTGTYAIDSDWEAWILTAASGTDERVVELMDALDEWEEEHANTA